jgi:hypothetical protein
LFPLFEALSKVRNWAVHLRLAAKTGYPGQYLSTISLPLLAKLPGQRLLFSPGADEKP